MSLITIDNIVSTFDSIPDEMINATANDCFYDENEIFPEPPQCVYQNENGDTCITGYILVKLGFDLPPVVSSANRLEVSQMMGHMGYRDKFTKEAVIILGLMQSCADKSLDDPFSWGKTKIEAIDCYNRHYKDMESSNA